MMYRREYYKMLPFKLGQSVSFPNYLTQALDYGVITEIRLGYRADSDEPLPGKEVYTVKYEPVAYSALPCPIAYAADKLAASDKYAHLSYPEQRVMQRQKEYWTKSSENLPFFRCSRCDLVVSYPVVWRPYSDTNRTSVAICRGCANG
jgi:hypothetical protein